MYVSVLLSPLVCGGFSNVKGYKCKGAHLVKAACGRVYGMFVGPEDILKGIQISLA